MKKITALLLAVVMLLSLAACAGGGTGGSVATLDPLTKDDVIQVVIGSHPSWPYREDWKIWEYIEYNPAKWEEDCFYPHKETE